MGIDEVILFSGARSIPAASNPIHNEPTLRVTRPSAKLRPLELAPPSRTTLVGVVRRP